MAQSIDCSEFLKTKTGNVSSYFIRNVCRVCANISDNVMPIFDKMNDKKSIYAKLKKCLPSVLVLENDMKPKQICLSCISKLDLCFAFVEMSRDADLKFEAILQNKITPQIHVLNDSLSNNKSSSNHHMKQPLEWPEVKLDLQPYRNESKLYGSSLPGLLNQVYHQKTFQQQITTSSGSTLNQLSYPFQDSQSVSTVKEDATHNVLQSLVMQEEISSQDVIVLELKYNDLLTMKSTPLIIRKPDPPSYTSAQTNKTEPNEITDYQTKIMDTNGNIRVINLSDFDGKFSHSEKMCSTLVNDSTSLDKNSNNVTTSTASILKECESDLLNAIKLTYLGLEHGSFAVNNTPSKSLEKPISTSEVNIVPLDRLSPEKATGQSTREGSSQSRDFRCNICGKQFTRRNRLNAHLARHSSERPHPCDKCDQRFITRWDLTLHLRIHSGIFSCEFCHKAFPAKGKLERHRRTHTGERPFPCTLCSKAFSEKRNLRNHLRTHTTSNDTEKTTKNDSNLWHVANAYGLESGNTTSSSCDKNSFGIDTSVSVTSKHITIALNSVAKRNSLTDKINENNDSNNSVSVAAFLKT